MTFSYSVNLKQDCLREFQTINKGNFQKKENNYYGPMKKTKFMSNF